MSEHEQALEEIRVLAALCSADQIQKVKDIFWQNVGDDEILRERFTGLMEPWCVSINSLPKTDELQNVNLMCLEITIGIIRRALHER
jgi:hypothetical protein